MNMLGAVNNMLVIMGASKFEVLKYDSTHLHCRISDAPSPSVWECGGQGKHAALPSVSVQVSLAHCIHDVAPTGDQEPASHIGHEAAPVLFEA